MSLTPFPKPTKTTGTQTSPTVLNNRLLTHLITETYTKYVDLKETVDTHQNFLNGSVDLLKVHETQINRSQELQELTEQVLRGYIDAQAKDISVIRARLSLLEGTVNGRVSILDSATAHPTSSAAATNQYNPFVSDSDKKSNPFA